MTPLAQAKLVLYALLLAAAIYVVYDYTTLSARNAALDDRITQLDADLKEATRQSQEAAKQYILRKEFDQLQRVKRQAITTQLETIANEDPAAAGYLLERIPDLVRAPFLER